MSTLHEIGNAVRRRRTEMGLTQQALAHISKLSRSTISAIEKQSITNLSLTKAQSLLESVGLSMNVATNETPNDRASKKSRSALARAASMASVSFGTALTAAQLQAAIISGHARASIAPHLQTLLDEAPMSLLAKVVDEIYVEQEIERALIWQQMRRLASQLKCFRLVWRDPR